jgi:hypothetical protein
MLAASGLFVGQSVKSKDEIVTAPVQSDPSGQGLATSIPQISPSNSSIAQSYLILDRDAKEILPPVRVLIYL